MTADQFWIALIKLVPYEVVTAYGIIRGAFAMNSSTTGGLGLFVVDLMLAIACFFLYRSAAKATVAAALSLTVCFFLFTLAVDLEVFKEVVEYDLTMLPKWILNDLLKPLNSFWIVTAAVFVVLASSSLRSVLGRPNGHA